MSLNHFIRILIFPIILISSVSLNAAAENIYKWKDSSGNVHYSTKPLSKNAEIAKLPEITRGEVKVPSTLLDSCKNHGGIDCQAGPDSDGSVKCSDGFADSAQRFSFSCSTAKLEVLSISDVSTGGGFTVNVRNSKSVAAESPKVFYKFDARKTFELSGPAQIAPFEVGEFLFDPYTQLEEKSRAEAVKKIKPAAERIELACANCP